MGKYYKKATSKDGYREICKVCTKVDELIYSRTVEGWLNKVYKSQHRSCEKRKMKLPTYSKSELKEWLLTKSDFLKIHQAWVKSNFDKNLIPSVDRKDDYITYTLTNINIVTWKVNNDKGNSDRVNCINTKASKSVIQYTIDMKKIKVFDSIAQAIRELKLQHGTHISSCCKGENNSAYGFKWRYNNG